jgi:hypothetical protein
MMPAMNNSGMNTAINENVIGESDLPCPLDGGFERRLAPFEIADDVLDHHDRIIDDEADGNGQPHERQIVEAVAEGVHHAEGADQREGHNDARNEGRPDIVEKQEDDRHHE